MKWEQLSPFTDLFSRRFDLILILNWQVFWLTSFFAAFPSRRIETVAGIAKSSLPRFTAAGTAPGSHGIPSSLSYKNIYTINLQPSTSLKHLPIICLFDL